MEKPYIVFMEPIQYDYKYNKCILIFLETVPS